MKLGRFFSYNNFILDCGEWTKMAKFGFSSLIHYIKINQYLQSAGMQNFSQDLTTDLIKVAALIFFPLSKLHFTFVFFFNEFSFFRCWHADCDRGPQSDRAGYAAWVRELKEAFRPKGLLLSAAVSPNKGQIF